MSLASSNIDAHSVTTSTAAPRIRVGFIVGPTGVGKSALALEIAAALGAEIVNADSRQLYRGMDLGTAKPSGAERARIAHHLIDVQAPDEPLDAAGFATMAHRAIAEIAARGRRVLVVGGSGLYLRALRDGIFAGPPASMAIRKELRGEAAQHGASSLHQRLDAVDADAAARISPNDLMRIIRALEVHALTGVALSEHHRRHRFGASQYTSLTVALNQPRVELYAEIDRRFDAMIAAGLVEETRALMAAGYDAGAPPLNTIGYREVACFIRGDISLEQACEQARQASRRLAKRQLTWFRAEPEIIWLDADRALPQALQLFEEFFADGA
jgi:tRNA dimethylallyltransferase